jgi:hypothetical protein
LRIKEKETRLTLQEQDDDDDDDDDIIRFKMLYVHIDILQSSNILYLDMLQKTFIISACKILYHNCIYYRLPKDEPSGSKHVEDIIKIKY